ncbi:DHS-like NAD/FAD-binding domain-containing protein [Schizophyllum amplum]|uniref:NAD-dependent protein deacylase n=1 Tax=Schizophyllum amplum TaxID=97359 RepID=A0A550C5V2_9AGAR|nr:DHS-like NAD/FAD-binding domain-containing protein [Auriculariopsis ampla]
MSPSSSIEDFERVLRKSENIVVVAGAGLSAASGIPTFRDAGGLWRGHDPATLATPSAFAANPSLVWQFYHKRRGVALAAQPNPGHFALAMLCEPAHLRVVAPRAKSFTLVTQNVDGLSMRARKDVHKRQVERGSAGSGDVASPHPLYEMHGRVLDTICTACGHREHNGSSPLCPSLGDASLENADNAQSIALEDLPRCAQCGGLLRPGVVWFEEVPHHMDQIQERVDAADLCMVVGTSSTVQPAAGYAYDVGENGGTVAVFNLQRSEGDEYADFLFLGPCEDTLPRILLNL